MKKSGIFVASITAASAAAATVSSSTSTSTSTSTSSSKFRISRHQDENSKKMKEENSLRKLGEQKSSDKFAPKFDGLRFIETLVTAHR